MLPRSEASFRFSRGRENAALPVGHAARRSPPRPTPPAAPPPSSQPPSPVLGGTKVRFSLAGGKGFSLRPWQLTSGLRYCF